MKKIVLISVITMSMLLSVFTFSDLVMATTNSTFDTQNITTGYSDNPTYKNAEDGSYNTLKEQDLYTDTNYSGNTENVVTGTSGGGSFPSSLDTDDATRRSYTEANSNPTDTTNYLYPTSDNSIGFDATYPTSPTTHFDKIDEVSHDDDTTYNTAVTNADRDVFNIGDVSGIVGTPVFHVVIHYWAMRAATGVSSMDVGLRIGSTDYVGINDVSAGAAYAELTYEWTISPATSSAWTESEINSVLIYMQCDDAAPDVRVTQCYLEIQIDYAINYVLDAQITYSSVTSTSQTTGYYVYCQGYRSGSENFGIYAWNYIGSVWDSKVTINSASDTDFNFDLTSEQRSSGTNEVKIRIVGLTETSDTTQDIIYLDLLKIRRTEIGYGLDISLTSTTVPSSGDVVLAIKGYTSGEQFDISVWNYTTSGWDIDQTNIVALSNTWKEFNLSDTHQRSTTSVKIRFEDATAYTSDQTRSTLYLDVAFVNNTIPYVYSDPVISDYGVEPSEDFYGENILFFLTVTDDDNQVMSYVRLYLNTTYYAMTENNSGDTDTIDGKAFYLIKNDIAIGWYNYYYAVKDSVSSEITTTPSIVTINERINNPPEFTSTPTTPIHNNTIYSYDANALDIDDYDDIITFDLEGNITDWATINPTTGVISGTPTIVGQYWLNVSASDGVNSLVWQNTSITIFSDAPIIQTTPTLSWENNTLYTYNAYATDVENEELIYGLTGNITDWATINPVTGVISGLPTNVGTYWLNLSVSDGINTVYDDDLITITSPSVPSGISNSQMIIFALIIMMIGGILVFGFVIK
jgi:hypothetical protein